MAITVNAGFWGDNYSLLSGKNPIRHKGKQLMNRRSQKKDKELIDTLLGIAPGQAALKTEKRIKAKTEDGLSLGGVVEIETVSIVDRVSTSADVTDLKKYQVDANVYTYPTNGAGVALGEQI